MPDEAFRKSHNVFVCRRVRGDANGQNLLQRAPFYNALIVQVAQADSILTRLDRQTAVRYACEMKPHYQKGSNSRIALTTLAAALCSLTNPIQAKCPMYSVRIHGRIECSFRPDVRVVATLLFSGRKSESPAKETAMDIQDSTFAGQVPFNTYSSSGLLSGDQCRRYPESVLVRITEADGTETDRRPLRIPTDFSFDEKRGEYTTGTDVVLHGQCISK